MAVCDASSKAKASPSERPLTGSLFMSVASRFWPVRDLRLKGSSPGLRTSSIPTQPYVAPHTAKIHTLITLGIRNRTKQLILSVRKRRPCGFDSHRPLHFSLSGVLLRCPTTPQPIVQFPQYRRGDDRSFDRGSIGPLVEFVLDCLIRPSTQT